MGKAYGELKIFDRRLTMAGGEEIDTFDLYKSSTETGPSNMYGTAMYGFTYTFNKNGADRARAIMIFDTAGSK